MNDFTSTERTLTENPPIQFGGFLSRSSFSVGLAAGPLTPEHFERAIESLMSPVEPPPISFLDILQSMAKPATVEDYQWWVGKPWQEGPRSTIEDLPPNPLYMELFL